MHFKDLGLSPFTLSALEDMGIENPTPIQEACLTKIIEQPLCHISAQAKTGSGKTLAFGIPFIENIDLTNKFPQALVLVPTRELCKQVSGVLHAVSKNQKISVVEIYGGASIGPQMKQLKESAHILVATPGRLIDIFKRGQVSLKNIKFIALDEADRMLDMGFIPDIRYLLLEAMKRIEPRLMLFSATMPKEILGIVKDFTRGQNLVSINVSQDTLTVPDCEQYCYRVDGDKYAYFVRVLKSEKPDYSIIFTKTKRGAERLYRRLKKENRLHLNVEYISGDLTQSQRERIIEQFRAKKINCLIGTNVLARGLDFPRVSHVYNYDIPEDQESYVHRIGRTARIDGVNLNVTPGKAVSLALEKDLALLKKIEKVTKVKIYQQQLPIKAQRPIAMRAMKSH
jgi:ATP-dependent RNA helicase DeaD